jgi:hypothetical protein
MEKKNQQRELDLINSKIKKIEEPADKYVDNGYYLIIIR